eukprot:m51a1_g14412 putative cop9 signalosome complex subunit 3 (629) ;mRNA; r:441879-445489
MDKLVGDIQALSAKGGEGDLRTLYERLSKSEELLAKHLNALDDVLEALSPAAHSLGYAVVLRARAALGRLPDPPRFLAKVRALVDAGAPLQLSIASREYSQAVAKATELMEPNYLAGAALARDALLRAGCRAGQITPLHTTLLRLCLLAHNYRVAAPFIEGEVTSTTDPSNSEALLCYFYYAGMVFVGLRRYSRALDMFRSALTVPAHTLSAIALEAYKKYVVVALIELGTVPALPKYAPGPVTRHIKSLGHGSLQAYSDLVTAYSTHDPAVVQALVVASAGQFKADGNAGIVKRAVAAMPRHAIRRCTKTYLTLSLDRLAQLANIPGGAGQAVQIILDMVQRGEMNASISMTDGMVAFLDESADPAAVGERLSAQLNAQVRSALSIEEKLRAADQEVSLSTAYIQRTQLGRLDRGPGRMPSGMPSDFYGDDSAMTTDAFIDECELAVLVARGVDASFFGRGVAEEGVVYELTLDGDLRIVEIPNAPHGSATGEIAGRLRNYRVAVAPLLPAGNRLGFCCHTDVAHELGINIPDGFLKPNVPSPAELAGGHAVAFPRLVVEVEYLHRTPRASRGYASLLMHTAHIRALLLVHVYPRNTAGLFAAAAVLWAKNAAGAVQLGGLRFCHSG